jgi:hypothetical protein
LLRRCVARCNPVPPGYLFRSRSQSSRCVNRQRRVPPFLVRLAQGRKHQQNKHPPNQRHSWTIRGNPRDLSENTQTDFPLEAPVDSCDGAFVHLGRGRLNRLRTVGDKGVTSPTALELSPADKPAHFILPGQRFYTVLEAPPTTLAFSRGFPELRTFPVFAGLRGGVSGHCRARAVALSARCPIPIAAQPNLCRGVGVTTFSRRHWSGSRRRREDVKRRKG